MHVLITGGAGFIGSHTADALIANGHRVRILDSLEKPVHMKGKPDYLPEDAEFILGDVRDKDTLIKAMTGVDHIIHLAAYQDYLPDFSKFFHVNVVSTAMIFEIILEQKLDIGRVVVASSQAVMGEGKYHCQGHGDLYPDIRPLQQLQDGDWEVKCPECQGELTHVLSDETVMNPQNQYAMSKYGQEMITINLGRRYQIPSVALRYSIVQGPRQSFYNAYSGACRIFSLNLFFDRAPILYEDGGQIRDYVNIQDVVRAILLVLEDPRASNQVYNVGGGKGYTVEEFARIVIAAYNKDIEPVIPGEFRFGDTRHIFSDISKLKALGWEPKVPIEVSVRNYIEYLRQQTDIDDIMDFARDKMKELNVVQTVARQ
jgi:dTDP-L-rhamnose 4-epimerase